MEEIKRMIKMSEIKLIEIGYGVKILNIQSQYCKKCKKITLHRHYDNSFESYGYNIFRKCLKCDNRTVEIFNS